MWFFLLFLCVALEATPSGVYRERVKQIDLVHNWTSDPNDQSFAQKGPLAEVYQVLKLKQTTLKITDLRSEKDSDRLTYIVVWNKPSFLNAKTLSRFSSKKMILFMWEPPVVQKELYSAQFLSQFKRVYTWDDDLVDNKKFFKFYYPVLTPMLTDLPSFEQRKLLTQISSRKKSKHEKELYTARLSVIKFFQDLPEGDFEFYGHGWGKEPYRHYLGTTDNKLETLKNYRFSICYENMRDVKGYITEKIFDCFAAGTIPIYWGASNITDFIPKECFIDRRNFNTFEEVYHHIQTMDQDTYQTYLKHIQTFLESDKAKLFSQDMFNVIFLEAIRFP